jgi:hypothetical protein
MTIPVYQVDAFTRDLFSGNPAAICPLPAWIPEEKMQQIAFENNLAETALLYRKEMIFISVGSPQPLKLPYRTCNIGCSIVFINSWIS